MDSYNINPKTNFKKAVGQKLSHKDGTFFMCLEDFRTYIDSVIISQVRI
jgi:hypothetical protein